MIRRDFVSNSSSTTGMFPRAFESLDFNFGNHINNTNENIPFYYPNMYDYYIVKFVDSLNTETYKILYREKPPVCDCGFPFPRFIQKFDIVYSSVNDAFKDFPEAEYCVDELEAIKKIFEKEPLKHADIIFGKRKEKYSMNNDDVIDVEETKNYLAAN